MRTYRSLYVVGIFLLFTSTLSAQSNRTFVAFSGSDANDCTRPTPCRSFAAAILKTNAGGEIVVLDSAGFGASLNITQAVSVIAPTGIYGGMTTTSGSAITVNAPGATVMLRGLYLNSIGGIKGVDVTDVGTLHIENCVVSGFQSNGIEFHGNAHLLVNDTTSRNNGQSFSTGGGVVVYGLDATHHAYASIENCRLERNGSGFAGANDAGVAARSFSEVTVRHSVASGNTRGFVAIDAGGGELVHLTVEDSEASNNVVGLFAAGGQDAIIRVSNCAITHNILFGMEAQGSSQITSRGNNTVIDNAGGETFSSLFSAK